jgi:ABC-2 type transport system ATP-binding protein
MPGMPGAVDVQDLRRTYGSVVAVDGASWSADAGTVTAVLGPNGAGKTTTVECLEGLVRPTSGAVEVLGRAPWGAPAEHRARVGVMLQDGGLATTVRPLPLLRHLASLHAHPRDVDALADRLGIGAFARTTVRRMSGGQRQRVALAASLVGTPDVLFLDEPTAGLDPHARLEVWEVVREESGRGACVVLTTHSFEEAERVADRVVIMAAGRVVADGTLDEVRSGRSLEDVYFDLTGGAPR